MLYGDVPLISNETLHNLLSQIKTNEMGIVTITNYNPTGFGRIVRDDKGAVIRIIEEKECATSEQSGACAYSRDHQCI